MSKTDKVWHQLFLDYMEMIVSHNNYEGLPIKRKENGELSWIATATSEIGKKRIEWAKAKAELLGIEIKPGYFQKVMYEVHPTKKKVCQTCGKTMSISYVYPNVSFVKKIEKKFNYITDTNTSIYTIVEDLLIGEAEDIVQSFFLEAFKISNSNANIKETLNIVENKCRSGKSKLLGPGAMSNFPDRYDGFHTYNRCCRSIEDKGRSSENLRSYTKDRRAYEYWSDGNIHAANTYMGSGFFEGSSADHIGPISLGFVHDSLFLRKMPPGDNSSKRDRLLYEDIVEVIEVEKKFNVSGMSWYSQKIWNYIKDNYEDNQKSIEYYRSQLKENMTNFMYVLWLLIDRSGESAKSFLIKKFLEPKMKYFKYNYKFGELGLVIKKSERNITKATEKEASRFYRVAFEAVDDYNAKENRNTKPFLSKEELEKIKIIIENIENDLFNDAERNLVELISSIQERIIKKRTTSELNPLI